MARKSPVAICITKHSPSIDPKFHQIERFLGAGRSTSLLFTIFRAGWDFRMGLNIVVGAKGAYKGGGDFYYC